MFRSKSRIPQGDGEARAACTKAKVCRRAKRDEAAQVSPRGFGQHENPICARPRRLAPAITASNFVVVLLLKCRPACAFRHLTFYTASFSQLARLRCRRRAHIICGTTFRTQEPNRQNSCLSTRNFTSPRSSPAFPTIHSKTNSPNPPRRRRRGGNSTVCIPNYLPRPTPRSCRDGCGDVVCAALAKSRKPGGRKRRSTQRPKRRMRAGSVPSTPRRRTRPTPAEQSEEAAQVSLHGFEHENRSARVLADYSSAKTASNFESALHRTSRNLHPSTFTFTPVSFSSLTRPRCLGRARIIQAAFVIAQEAGSTPACQSTRTCGYPRRLTAFHRFREPFSAARTDFSRRDRPRRRRDALRARRRFR